MKPENVRHRWSVIALGFCLSVTLLTASAEPFVDRGILWTSAAPAGTYESKPPSHATVEFFNSRGVHWAQQAPSGTYASKPSADAKWQGWMQK